MYRILTEQELSFSLVQPELVTSARLQLTHYEYLNIAEFRVFDDQNVNVALTSTASLSSQWDPPQPGFMAIDNDTATHTHTELGEGEWILLEFDPSVRAARVEIVPRPGQIDRSFPSVVIFNKDAGKPCDLLRLP